MLNKNTILTEPLESKKLRYITVGLAVPSGIHPIPYCISLLPASGWSYPPTDDHLEEHLCSIGCAMKFSISDISFEWNSVKDSIHEFIELFVFSIRLKPLFVVGLQLVNKAN